MSETGHIAAAIFRHGRGTRRLMVAIAGPPASGKSMLAASLAEALAGAGQTAAVVGLDGFHYDDAVLAARGHRARKGAPHTFDFHGFRHLLARIRANEEEVAVPVFDRSQEFARAGASVVAPDTRFVLVEGNYLLLDDDPWRQLAPLFDFSVFLDVPRAEIERRLGERWRGYGRSEADARQWIVDNDLPNVELVLSRRRLADLVVDAHGGPPA